MTKYQRLAKEYLDQYRHAKNELKRLRCKLDEARARAENIKSSLNLVEGWTGLVDKKGKKITVPITTSKSPDVQSQINLLHVVVSRSIECDNKETDLIALCREIENGINELLGPCVESVILKYRYIDLLSYEQIAVNINYSYSHTKRLHWKGLDTFGKELKKRQTTKDEPQ